MLVSADAVVAGKSSMIARANPNGLLVMIGCAEDLFQQLAYVATGSAEGFRLNRFEFDVSLCVQAFNEQQRVLAQPFEAGCKEGMNRLRQGTRQSCQKLQMNGLEIDSAFLGIVSYGGKLRRQIADGSPTVAVPQQFDDDLVGAWIGEHTLCLAHFMLPNFTKIIVDR